MDKDIRVEVREHYTKSAERAETITANSCCSSNYSRQLLDGLPQDVANFSLGCGDPITLSNLQPGERVLDLGSGGGLDCFLAAQKVGEQGRVIGVDMTPKMIELARANAKKMGVKNVEFRQGYLENLPVDDDSFDVVISNCVINLSPDKQLVFDEILRVLKPGGKVAISDILRVEGSATRFPIETSDGWSECVTGALESRVFEDGLLKAGFTNVEIKSTSSSDIPIVGQESGPIFSALISATKPQ